MNDVGCLLQRESERFHAHQEGEEFKMQRQCTVIHNQFPVMALLLFTGYAFAIASASLASENAPGNINDELVKTIRLKDSMKAKELIKKGADVNCIEKKSSLSCLQIAILQNDQNSVELLIVSGADPNRSAAHETSPLVLSSQMRNLDISQALIKAGARSRFKASKRGRFPHEFHYVSKFLKSSGLTDEERKKTGFFQSAEMMDRNFQLLRQCLEIGKNGDLDSVRKHIENGADPNAVLPSGGTAMDAAIICGRRDLVKLLLEEGIPVHSYSEHFDHISPLALAVRKEQLEIAKLLIGHGGSINRKSMGRPIIQFAKSADAVRWLVSVGAEINATNEKGETALDLAKDEMLANALIEAGALRSSDPKGSSLPGSVKEEPPEQEPQPSTPQTDD